MPKTRKNPRISVNKLCEYLQATPSRRKRIIKDQKSPSSFKADYYNDALEQIQHFMEGKASDEDLMEVKECLLRKAMAPRNDHHGTTLSCSADAIEKFLDVEEEIDMPEDVAVESGETFEQDYWECGGTTVSMRPDMLLYKKAEDGTRDVVGAVKFSFSKTNPVGEEGCDYLSTALWRHLVDNCGHNADRDCCFAVDIPSGVVATPGKSFKRKMDNIKAACEEIADRWDKV